jgi:hypothetical protein
MSKDGLRIRGFMRGQLINQDGSIAGDTGWGENRFVNTGLIELAKQICTLGGSVIRYGQIGSLGTVTDVTTNIGNFNSFIAVTPTTSGNGNCTFTCSFASGSNSAGASYDLKAFGLFGTNSGNPIAARTFASSPMANTQAFLVTHVISFATGSET